MVFSEYAREKFCGDEERALMHMAKNMALFIAEKDFPDKDFVWSPEWFNIAKSFTEEQREAYSRYLEIYEQEHKILLTKEKVLLKTKDFPKKRNVLLALSILVTVFFCFWVFPLAVVMLIVDIPLLVWL